MNSYNHLFHTTNTDNTDTEWEKANKANETPKYYIVHKDNGCVTYQLYKPSVADLVRKRTGWKLELVHSEPKKHTKKVEKKAFWL